MNVFFDTEFTGLTSDPHLISIGLVADNGNHLYIELTNGWAEAQCSSWVRNHVLPQLGTGEKLGRRDAANRILIWLSSFETETTLLGETDWDTILISQLLGESKKAASVGCRINQLAYRDTSQARSFENAKRDFLETIQASPHHALNDAWAFRAAWHLVFVGR